MRRLEEITIWGKEGIHTKLLDGTSRRDNHLMKKIITPNFSMILFRRDNHLKEKDRIHIKLLEGTIRRDNHSMEKIISEDVQAAHKEPST